MKKTTIVATKVTHAVKERIEQVAKGQTTTVSDWVRTLILEALENEL